MRKIGWSPCGGCALGCAARISRRRDVETRFQRIAREQRERQAKRAAGFGERIIDRQQARARASAKRAWRRAEAMEREAETMPDSFDPPERQDY